MFENGFGGATHIQPVTSYQHSVRKLNQLSFIMWHSFFGLSLSLYQGWADIVYGSEGKGCYQHAYGLLSLKPKQKEILYPLYPEINRGHIATELL